MKIITYISGLVLLLYVILASVLFIKQRTLIYFPTDEIQHGEKEVVFHHAGQTIKTIVLNPGRKHALLYFGGNAEAVALNAEQFNESFSDYTIYLVNYRGYGGSTGSPSEQALYADAIYIFDQIAPSYEQVSIMGRSLGSGVASYLASQRDVNKTVLVTPFDSIEHVAQAHLPWFPMSILLKDKFDSASRTNNIRSDVLILVAEHDRVVPRKQTESLVASFSNKPASLEVITGTDHNNILEKAQFYQVVSQFLQQN